MAGTGKLTRRVRVPGNMEVHSMIFADLMGIGRDNCMLLSDREHMLMVLNEKLELLWEQEVRIGSATHGL